MNSFKDGDKIVDIRTESMMGKSKMKMFVALLFWVVAVSPSFAEKGDAQKKSSGAGTAKTREEGGFVIEKRSDGSTIKYKKKSEFDFEGANIEGLYNKPSGSYISNIKDVKARSIIRIRDNFDAEVIDSARLVK